MLRRSSLAVPAVLLGLPLLCSCVPGVLPTPDRAALAVLPTATPTLPTPLTASLPPRPTDTPTPVPTATPTATSTATMTPTPSPTATPTASPTPTFTATPGPLASALGFSDEFITSLDAAGYRLAEQQVVDLVGAQVVAYLLSPPESEAAVVVGDLVPRLVVYRHVAGQRSQRLFADEGSDVIVQFGGLGYRWEEPLGWQDINADGLLELPVWAANGGACWACTRTYILQLRPVGQPEAGLEAGAGDGWQIVELTGAVPFLNLLTHPTVPKWLNDLDGDGLPEIELLDGRFEFAFGLERAASPGLYRVYRWDGSRYADASRHFPAYFDYQIERARAAVEATYGQPLQGGDEIGKAVIVLLAYDARGQREEGWAAFWQLSDPGHWPGEAVEGAMARLLAVREHLHGQYERGEEFAPWLPEPVAVDEALSEPTQGE